MQQVALFAVCLALSVAGAMMVKDTTNWAETRYWGGGIGACVKIVTAPTGEVFCGAKDGVIRKFPSIKAAESEAALVWQAGQDMTATWGDRGMLGMAIDPNYPASPYIWILMSVRRLESADTDANVLPNICDAGDGGSMSPTATCDEAARLYRLKVTGDSAAIDQLLMTGWCSNGLSHHIGNLDWARDGGLYVSGGDGASYTNDDRGTPGKPCYRSTDSRFQGAWRPQWDEYTHGKIFYLSKDALYGNALITIGNGARIVAKGLRNPFRFAIHPVTYDIYVGDVGSDFYEEINLIPDPLTNNNVPNFGWPCFEGNGAQPRYGADNGCADVAKVHTKPFITYSRGKGFNIDGAKDNCMRGTVSTAAFAFMNTTEWGSKFQNRLFWADSSMQCIFILANDNKGMPSADTTQMELLAYNGPTSSDGQIVGLMFAGTGAEKSLYALEYYSSELLKIDYLGDKSIDPTIPVANGPSSTGKSKSSVKSSAATSSFTAALAALFAALFYAAL